MSAISNSDSIAVIGAGVMGSGIAQVAAQASHTVFLYDLSEDVVNTGIDQITTSLSKLVNKNKMTEETKEQLLQRIKPVNNLENLKCCRLIIEAIVEKLEIKQQLFEELEKICDENTIFATNTSSLSITAISSVLQRPQNFAGMHFFNPAPIMKLVEIVSGIATDPKVADILFQTTIAWGKKAIYVKSTPGFVVNRVARPFYAEALRVFEEGGADIATIDAIMRDCGGFRMGPFELMDLIGNDINYAVTTTVFSSYYNDPRFLPSLSQKELVDGGFLGRKTGRGFYDYGKNATKPEPDTLKIIDDQKISSIKVCGNLARAQSIVNLLKAKNIEATYEDSDLDSIIINDTHITLTDGRTATERSATDGVKELVLFDLALDYHKAKRIVITSAIQSNYSSINIAAHFFQLLGFSVSVIQDIPGMIVMRTICMLANEGADTVNQQICDAQAVDTAMECGVNYPLGPLAWAELIGLDYVVTVLKNLERIYGQDRFRVSPLLQRNSLADIPFHE